MPGSAASPAGFTTVVWVGKDDNTSMRKVTGGGPPAELWKSYMALALPHLQVQHIPAGPPAPAGVVYGDPIGDLLSHTGAAAPGPRAGNAGRRPRPAISCANPPPPSPPTRRGFDAARDRRRRIG